jgi:dolichyl-phosphate beta-glucosyltransferase
VSGVSGVSEGAPGVGEAGRTPPAVVVKTLSVVVPAYNEAGRLDRLLDAVSDGAQELLGAAHLELAEVLIVDDGSIDDTAALLRERAGDRSWLVPVVPGTPNRGKGAALASGVAAARGELTLLCDVDLAVPFREAVKLRDGLESGADIAIASRGAPGARLEGIPLYREAMGRLFNKGMRLLTGLPYADTQCGFKLMSTRVASRLLVDLRSSGYAFDVEILLRARAAGFSVVEVGVEYRHDRDSRVRPVAASSEMARDLVRLSRMYGRRA